MEDGWMMGERERKRDFMKKTVNTGRETDGERCTREIRK